MVELSRCYRDGRFLKFIKNKCIYFSFGGLCWREYVYILKDSDFDRIVCVGCFGSRTDGKFF